MVTTPRPHDDDDDANLVAVSVEDTGRSRAIKAEQAQAASKSKGPRLRRSGKKSTSKGKKKVRALRPQTPDWLTSPALTFIQAVVLAGLAFGGLQATGVLHSITTTTVIIKYLSGKTPIDASVDVARRDFNSAETVLVIQQDDFVDGTLAAGLSGAMHAPLLLSDTEQLTPRTLDVIREINPKRVILLGGEVLLSPNIQTQLESQIEVEVVRFAGLDMQNTMVAIDNEVARLTREEFNRPSQRGVLVDPKDLFNAAAAGAVAADWKNPASMLLADGDTAIPETDQLVKGLNLNEVFGFNASVAGPKVLTATTLQELATLKGREDGDRLSTVFLVPQDDTHRAMLAAPAAGKAGGVVLPVNNEDTLAWLRDACPKITEMTLLAPDGEFLEEYNKAIEAVSACGAEVENPKSSVTIPLPAETTPPPAPPTPTPTIHLPPTTVAPEAPIITEDPQAIEDALAPAAPEG
ncbi:cell wall-binding repeat-containing protein [Stomatohabitans albus]|uniref:cell wall-binding repeat-containing protein n=1 Tax=Stomatohabitans albus TaxID=3110766 RepID=UPI00300BFFB2